MKSFIRASMFISVAAFACASLLACPKSGPPPEPPIADVVDASYDDAGDDPEIDAARFPACVKACRRLKSLGCPEANTLDGGLSCYQLCAKSESSGKFTLHPECVANAASKDTLRTQCNVRCMP